MSETISLLEWRKTPQVNEDSVLDMWKDATAKVGGSGRVD